MTRLTVWFSFIIVFDLVYTLPRIVPKGKLQKKVENGFNVSKSIKRTEEIPKQNLNGSDVTVQYAAKKQKRNGEENYEDANDNDTNNNSANNNNDNNNNDNDENDYSANDNYANDANKNNDDDTNYDNNNENDIVANDNHGNDNDANDNDASDNDANANDDDDVNDNDANANDDANDNDANDNNANDNDANDNDANDNDVSDNDVNNNDANDNDVNDNDANDNDANNNDANDNDANDNDANNNDANDNDTKNYDANDNDANNNDANDNDADDNDFNDNGADDNDTNDNDVNDNYANDNDANDNDDNDSNVNENDAQDLINDDDTGEINEKGDSNIDDNIGSDQKKYEVEDEQDTNVLPRRPLTIGDILTPQELLPVTTKLISKVDSPGKGKGIVSSAKNPEVLADRLFEAFFLTSKRIVNLTEFDISGIDALQALALSGDVVDDNVEPETEKPLKNKLFLDLNEQRVEIDKSHGTSKYTLLTKEDDQNDTLRKKMKRRQGIHKKLKKKDRLLRKKNREERIKKYLRNQKSSIKIKNKSTKMKFRSRLQSTENSGGVTSNKYLKKNIFTTSSPSGPKRQLLPNTRVANASKKESRWQYECKDPSDLDTCNIKIKHIDPGKKEPFIGVKHRKDEHTDLYKQFRKMLKLTLIDEEVEKILENRVLRLRPPKRGSESERIETLNEYFNNIIINEHKSVTSPMNIEGAKNVAENPSGDEIRHEDHDKINEEEDDDIDPNGRRILGVPSISTPRPYTNKMANK